MNNTIKFLIFSDVFVVTGFGLIDPILAIFMKENILGGSIAAASLATTFFLITKCAVQLPFSRYVDNHDEKYKWLIIGSLLTTSVPFIYIFAKSMNHIYFAQIISGIGSGLVYPTWLGIWTTHLDKTHESYEWTLYSTTVSIGSAITAGIGGVISQFIGFTYTFMVVGVMSMIGVCILLGLEHRERKQIVNRTSYSRSRNGVRRRSH